MPLTFKKKCAVLKTVYSYHRSASPIELLNSTITENCLPNDGETQLITKVCYAIWVWAIFLTFPGTYSMQPAVTTHTFGHKYTYLLGSIIVCSIHRVLLYSK